MCFVCLFVFLVCLLSQEYSICLRQSVATNILSLEVNGFEFQQVFVFELCLIGRLKEETNKC